MVLYSRIYNKVPSHRSALWNVYERLIYRARNEIAKYPSFQIRME